MNAAKTYEQLEKEIAQLRIQLEEATDILQAIRTGQIDALVVEGTEGKEIYTLKTADQTYRVFIETMHEGAVTLDEHGLILYSNSTFAVMVDRPLSDVIGTLFSDYIMPIYRTAYVAFYEQSRQIPTKAEIGLGHGKNELICLLSATPLLLDEGPCLSLILTDLTLQKQMQAQLESSNEQLVTLNTALMMTNQALNRSNDSLQQFAYVASHDLQEPLRKIQQFGDLLNNHYTQRLGEGRRYVERMQSSAGRMSTLIQDLLNYSHISIRPQTLNRISLAEVVNRVLVDLELRIQETNALIEIGSLPTVMGDASQLGQLFLNLFGNALKFQEPGSTDAVPLIRVQSRQVSADDLPTTVKQVNPAQLYHCIDVSDNGIGFDEKYAERIFQVFQRLHGKNEFIGTGIGLAICEKVVTNHGGAITATGTPGRGATFSVYLPA